MQIEIKIDGRNLNFSCQDEQGSSLEQLIGFIGRENGKINKVKLSGESGSYTAIRQAYLFLNLYRELSGCQVEIDGKVARKGFIAPDYSKTGYVFKGEK